MFMLSALLCAGAFFTASCGDDDEKPVPNNGTENPSGGNGTENPSGGNGSGTETPTTTPTYTVTFDTDGGTTINAQIVDKDGKVTKPTDPTKDGYNFKGWNNGTAPYDFSASVTSDLTLNAIWEKLKESYTVTFDSDGGTAINAQIVDKDGKVTKPADPIKDGYNFVLWNNGTSPYDFSAVVTADLTLKAIWEKVKIFYAVTFDTDGGTTITAQTVEEGGKANKPEDPTKEGYNFVQWNNGSTPYDFSVAVTADLTLKAVWEEIPDPNGGFASLPGAFSVSAKKQVVFSSGNLQFQPSTWTWRFAPSQTDAIGIDYGKITDASYDGWIDLFGWGTGDVPTKTSTSYSDYPTFTDWGKNIGDGVTWYTLSYDEWYYIFNDRKDAKAKRGIASVNGVNGYILLPDAFTLPAGLTFNSGVTDSYGAEYFKTINDYTSDQWSKMEAAGAVFLPAAGRCRGYNIRLLEIDGDYWSSTSRKSSTACYIYFDSRSAGTLNSGDYRNYGCSVRLVRSL